MGKSQGGWRVFLKYRSSLRSFSGKVGADSITQRKLSNTLHSKPAQDPLGMKSSEAPESIPNLECPSEQGVTLRSAKKRSPHPEYVRTPSSSYSSDEWNDILSNFGMVHDMRGSNSPSSRGHEQGQTVEEIGNNLVPLKMSRCPSPHGSPGSSHCRLMSYSSDMSPRDGDARAPEERWFSDVKADAEKACSEDWTENARARIQNAAWKVVEAQMTLHALNAETRTRKTRKYSLDSKSKMSSAFLRLKAESSTSSRRKSLSY